MSNSARGVLYNSFGDTVSLYYKGRQCLYASDRPEYTRINEVVNTYKGDEQSSKLLELFKELTEPKPQPQAEDLEFTVKDSQVTARGRVLPPTLGKRFIQHKAEGQPCEPIMNYWDKLVKNPSFRNVEHQYDHLERHHHPLLPDGNLLGWKRVRDDFKDFYTGTFDNSVGQTVSMPRNEVDENPDHTCSRGLHIANYGYAKDLYQSGRGRLIEVSIDPADVVAIPRSYDGKMRVCRYTVLSVCEEEDKNLVAGHTNPHDFAVHPDAGSLCELHNEHRDFCSCNNNEDYCPECGDELEDGYCAYCEDDD